MAETAVSRSPERVSRTPRVRRQKAAFDTTNPQSAIRNPPSLPTMKLLTALLSFLLLALLTPSPGADRKLLVGMDLSYPPFEMRDQQGAPAGVSVDLAQALGARLGMPVDIQNLPFSGLIPALRTGKIDLVISSMTSTPERAQSIDFSEPYLKTGLCLLVGARTNIQSIADCDRSGQSIVVVRGTTGHLYAVQHVRAARVLVLDQPATCVLEVVQGKAEAFIFDQMSTLKNWQKNPETTRALLTPFQEETWAIGLRKGNDDLRAKVNAFIDAFRKEGGFEKLGDKWLPEQKAEFKKRGIPFLF
jgi:polar amino acid transport system substrate-binding protein